MPTKPEVAAAHRKPLLVDLALQGGGAHGAFTWGVLDRLLEEPWLQIDGISGTSAGAMNAAVLADGYAERRPPRAPRRRWRSSGAASPRPRCSAPCSAGRSTCCWAAGRSTTRRCSSAIDLLARLFSPYDLNPGRRQPAARHPGREHRFRRGWPRRRSSSSSPPPTCAPGAGGCSATPRSRRRCCWPRPACRRCSRRSRSTARPIGTAAMPAIRRSRRWCANAHRDDTILVADQPGRTARHAAHGARHPQSPERGLVQRRAAEGAADDRAAAAGGRSGRRRGRACGRACASTCIASTMMLELGYSSKLNAEWAFSDHAARRGAARGGRVSQRPCGRSRPGLLARSRRAARGRVTGLGPSAAPPKA